MKQIEIYWNDLTKEKQDKIINEFGDNFNWDIFPMATIDICEDGDEDVITIETDELPF